MQLVKIIILTILIPIFLSTDAFSQPKKVGELSFEKLEKYITKAYKTWNIPGLSIGIVKDGKIVYTKGFGVRDITKKDKVDENTVFGIASNTKAFTATALAILVDRGKISWDDKVIDYIPYFRMYNNYVTQEMTIRDLLCHRSGLATFSGDLIWYASNYSREEVIRRAKFLTPIYGFRENYGYSNIMFLAAGEIIPAVTEKSYDDFIQKEIFEPLEMTNTNSSISKLTGVNDAVPHNFVDGKSIKIDFVNWDNIAPAGAINSTAADMCNWMVTNINLGSYGANEIVKNETCWELQTPQLAKKLSLGEKQFFKHLEFKGYGLGWDIMNYRKHKVVNHSGGLDGMISHLAMIPDEKFGFVVLTNSNSSLPYALMLQVIDMYCGDFSTDWSDTFYGFKKRSDENDKHTQKIAEDNRNKTSKTTLALDEYAGTYSGNVYGNVKVSVVENALFLEFSPTPLFNCKITHWQYDCFEIKMPKVPSLPSGKVHFVIDENGKVSEMKIIIPNPDFDFTQMDLKRMD